VQLKIRKWVDDSGGIKSVAEKLRVGEHQVRAWLRGEATPRSKTLNQIIRLSKGQLTFDIIYKETSRCKEN
jgi:DNA-binding phage protein